MRQVCGKDLKVGDVVEVWWNPQRDTIVTLQPYTGPIAHIFKAGAQLATFALLKSGMTIDNGEIYTVINP